MTENATSGLQKLQEVTRRDIEEIAKKYSSEKSSFLAGVAGAIAGTAGGVAVSSALGVVVVVSGPAGATLGVALAILAWRGLPYWKLERAMERLKMALDQIRKELNSLPEDTPPHVWDKLWQGYEKLLDAYTVIATKSVRADGWLICFWKSRDRISRGR